MRGYFLDTNAQAGFDAVPYLKLRASKLPAILIHHKQSELPDFLSHANYARPNGVPILDYVASHDIITTTNRLKMAIFVVLHLLFMFESLPIVLKYRKKLTFIRLYCNIFIVFTSVYDYHKDIPISCANARRPKEYEVMGAVDPRITDAMFIIALLAFTGAFKAIYAGWTVRETSPFFRLVATQRRRYTFLALGQSILAACAVWPLSLGSISDIVAGTEEWFALGVIGWIVGSGVVLVAVSPLISVLALISIYRNPAAMAYKRFRRDEYCTTQSRRVGEREFVRPITVVDPEKPRTGTFRGFLAI